MLNFMPRRRGKGEKGQAFILVLILLAFGIVIMTALLGFIGTGAKTGTVYDKKAAELYAADAGIQDAIWQIRNQQLTTTCPTYNRYDFTSPGWSYDIPPVNNENVHVQLWNMWMIPTTIVPQPVTQADITKCQNIATGGQLIVTGNTIMPALTANDNVTTIYEYDINIAYNPGASDLVINDIGIWFPPGYSLFPDETNHKCSLTGLPGNYTNAMSQVSLAGNNCWYWAFPNAPTFIDFPVHNGTAPSTVTVTVKLYFKPPQDQSTLKPDAVAWIKTTGNSAIPFAWDSTTTIVKTSATAKKGSDTGTTIDSYMAHSELPQMQTAQAGDYVATGKTLMLGVDPASNQRELLLNDNSNTVIGVPTNANANANVELAYLYWTGWLKQPLVGSDPSVGIFWDNGNNLNNWTFGNPSSWSSSGTSPGDFYGQFVGHYSSGGDPARYLTLANAVDLRDTTGTDTNLNYTSATIQWQQQVVTNPITLRAAGANATGTTSVTCLQPNGTAANDVLVAFIIDHSTTNGQSTAPAGWLGTGYAYASGKRFQVFTAVVGKNSLTGSQWIFTGLTTQSQGVIIGYYNADTSGWGGLDTAVSVRNNASGTYGTTGITTVTDGDMVIAAFGSYVAANPTYNWSSESCATIGALNERFDNKNGAACSIAIADILMTTHGATGNSNATPYSGKANAGILLALKPAEINTIRLSISKNGGAYTEVGTYSGNSPNSPTGSFSYTLAAGYLHSQIKFRFYLDGFGGPGESASLDNIGVMVTNGAINTEPADTTVTFSITRDDGTVNTFTTPLTADYTDPNQVQSQIKDPLLNPNDGYYYGCRVDVTNLVRSYSDGADMTHYGIGNGIYDVAGVYADSLKADSVTYGSASFAGWSLVIIYSSTDTLGHQLYLYDLKSTFRSVPATPANTQTQQITGFIVPQPVATETEAARLTIFVGEGDIQITGDYVAIVDQRDSTEHYLWDGVGTLPAPYTSSNTQAAPFNVWNGRSTGSTGPEAGIDVDTFSVPWGTPTSTGILRPGDTSANIHMYTNGDGYVTVYMILSFRSTITTGGSISYLIRN
jgi:hypothetical protein